MNVNDSEGFVGRRLNATRVRAAVLTLCLSICAWCLVVPLTAQETASVTRIEPPTTAIVGAESIPANTAADLSPTGEPHRHGERDTSALFWSFLRLGVEHIWTGYDHLLFLLGLLIVCRTLRGVVAIISCFTVAHSLTLALATFDLVALPARWVEPAIAASIVFVGLENLWRKGAEPRGRMLVTFCFGLIHGFGFANVLRGVGVGSGGRGIALPLFTFNLGVELGQIAVAAVVLPIMWRLRKSDGFVRRGLPIMSGAVTLVGLYWFVERVVLR